MKKTLIVLAVLLINSIAGMQQASAQIAGESWLSSLTKRNDVQGVQFGLRTGLNFPTLVESEEWFNFSSYTGFHVGIIADIPLSSGWYIQPGLYFENKGANTLYEDDYYDYTQKCKFGLAYIDIPVLLSYRFNLSDAMQLHLNAGPFIGFGVLGKLTGTYHDYDAGESGNIISFNPFTENGYSDEAFFSRFDAGLSLGAGVSVGKIYFGLKYDLGMINLLDDSDRTVKTSTFGITLGVNF
jgi:hypothetical protein